MIKTELLSGVQWQMGCPPTRLLFHPLLLLFPPYKISESEADKPSRQSSFDDFMSFSNTVRSHQFLYKLLTVHAIE